MEPYLKSIDLDRSLNRTFVNDYYEAASVDDVNSLVWPLEHLTARTFRSNESALSPTISEEVHGPFREAFRRLGKTPFMPELRNSYVTQRLQGWVEHLVEGSLNQSWNRCWTVHIILHVYRRIAPPQFQSRAHMEVVYAVAAAFDMATTTTVLLDDMVDYASTRNGLPAWHVTHPVTLANDVAMLLSIGSRVIRFLLPAHHPLKAEMFQLYDDYVHYTNSYFALVAPSRQPLMPDRLRSQYAQSVDDVTTDTYRSMNWMRGGFYVYVLHDLPRLLACYRDVISTEASASLYFDFLSKANGVLTVADDLRDTQVLARKAGIGSEREAASLDTPQAVQAAIEEFSGGDVHHIFLLASLQLARGESPGQILNPEERTEVLAILRECYVPVDGTSSKTSSEEQDQRILRLCSMFLKYDVHGYIKSQILPQAISDYLVTNSKAVELLGVPSDFLSHSLGTMVCEDKGTRSDQLATKVAEIMNTMNTEISEKDKLGRMFDVLSSMN